MAQNFKAQMIENVAIDTTPNLVMGGMSNDDLLALLDNEEVIEPSVSTVESDPADEVQILPAAIDETDIGSLLGALDLNITAEVPAESALVAVEPEPAPVVPEIDEAALLADVVAAAESTEIAAAVATVEVIAPGAVPTTAADGSDAMVMGMSADDLLADLENVTEPESEPADPADPADPATPKAPRAAAAPRAPAAPRKLYADKAERLKDRVGDDLSAASMLTTADATLDPAEAIERVLHIIKGMNKKEQNRASNLVEFVTGKRTSLNTVLERIIKLLHKDGFVTTGENGTVMADLLAKPYAPGSARAMGANTVAVFADMMLIKADGKGRYIANPESVLLVAVKQKLGLV